MKLKILTCLITAVLVLLLTTGVASADPSVVVDVPETAVPLGETVTIPVVFIDAIPFAGFGITVVVPDDSPVTVTINKTESLSGTYTFKENGKSLSYFRTTNITTDSTLFYIDVLIDEQKPILNFSVELDVYDFSNDSPSDILNQITVVNGTVNVQRQADVASYPEATNMPSSLSYGETGTLSAVVYNQYNEVMTGAQVTWTSSNPECLSIDALTGAYQVIGCSVSPVTVSVSCGDGEYPPTVTVKSEIHLVKSTLVLSDFVVSPDLSEDIIYDGTAKEVTLTPVFGKDGVGTVTIKYNGITTVPVSVGSYIVTAELSEGTNYNASTFDLGTLNITGKAIAKPVLGDNLTYNGELQNVPLSTSLEYAITGQASATAAGVYTVSVALNDYANMTWEDGTNGELTYVWEITPKDISETTVTLSGDFTYDGNGHAPTVSITNNGIELSTNDYYYGGDLQNVTAGTHSLSLFGQNNYTGEIIAEWKIKQAVPSVENISCILPTGIVYNGNEYTVTVSKATGVYGLGTITVYYNGDAKAPVSAGDYEVTVTIAEGTNYTATTSPLSLGSFTIQPAELSIENLTYSLESIIYDGKEHPVSVTLKEGTGDITVTYDDSIATPVSAGIYLVNVSVENLANYNNTEFSLGTFTINRAALSLENFTITPTLPASIDYDGSAKNVTVKAKDVIGIGEITVTYNDVATEPVALGDYQVNVTVAEGTNYTAVAFNLGTLKISKLTIIEPTISAEFAYDGSMKTPEIIDSSNSAGYYTVLEDNRTATAAGTYTITVQLKDSGNTSWSKTSGDLKLTWSIAPKSILDAVITTSDKFTYDGSVKTPSFVLKDGGVTISPNNYEIGGDVSNASAGTHYVAFQGTNNYTNVITSEWTIERAVPTVDVIDYNIPTGVIYNGQPQGITAALNASYVGVGALTVSYGGSTEIPTNAGTYVITASVTEGENYKAGEFNLGEYVILPAELSKDNLSYSLDAVTYDGKEHAVSVTLEDGKTGDLTVTYNDSTAVPVSAGTYMVNVSVANVANYNDTEFSLGTFTINKAELTAENFVVSPALTESIVFDGDAHPVTVTPQGIAGYGEWTVTYNGDSAEPVAIGTYKVNVTVDEGQNYTAAELNLGTLTITGLKIAEPSLSEIEFTYDGSAKTPEIVDSTNSKDRYIVVQENLTATAAGTYTITLQLKDAANTSWSGASGAGDLKLTWSIKPTSIAGVSVSTMEETITYDGSEKKPDFVVKSGEAVLNENDDYEITGTISSFAAGIHTVTVTGKNNYTGTETGTWVIAKAAPTADVVDFTIPTGVVYNSQPQGITAALNASYAGVGELTLKYYNGTTEEQPVNAGIYLVNASVAEGQNYTAAEFTLGNYEILRANPSVDNLTFTLPQNAVYNGTMFEADCAAKEGVGLGAITVVYNATPIAAGTYKVNASIAESLNFNATELTIGEFTIAKAALTIDNLTVTPELPVSYDNASGSVKPVVVTVKPGIFGNGTIMVEYGESTALPTLAGVYKVNANITAGTNYTQGIIYLGNMTVVEKVVPDFDVDITTTETNTTVTGVDTVDSTNTTQISDDNGVVLKITFSDYEQKSTTVSGNISAVIVQYPEKPAASPQKKAEGTTYNLTIDLGDKLTTALPEITPVYNKNVEEKVSQKVGSTNTNSKTTTFTGLAMMTATGDNVDDINKNITEGKGNIKLTFTIPKFDLSDEEKIVVYHVSGNTVVKVYDEDKPTAVNGHYLITVTGSGFSSYVAGIETTTVDPDNTNKPTTYPTGSSSSGKKPTTVPTTPPTEDPTEDPTDKPDTPDVPGIDTPTEPETPATPAPVAGMILGALAAAAVLRRK